MKKKNSATSIARTPIPAVTSNASPIALTQTKPSISNGPQVKLSDSQTRALRLLVNGSIAFNVVAGKPTEWEWDFPPATLRELNQLGLADYMILATGNRTWFITLEGNDVCGELPPA